MDRRRRKRLIDLALVIGVFVPWFAIFVLHAQEAAQHGFAQPGFVVAGSPTPGGPPQVTSFRREWNGRSDAIRVGDRILSVGSRDLHGVGHIGFDAAALAEANGRSSIEVTIERAEIEADADAETEADADADADTDSSAAVAGEQG